MNYTPPELFLMLQQLDTARHLTEQHRYRVAEARQRAEIDRQELDRAWQLLNYAIQAEARSRAELLTLTT